MNAYFKKIKEWWVPFFKKHEPEIICTVIKAPGYGIAVCIPPKAQPIWVGVLICCIIIITAWITAYCARKYKNNKKQKIYERYNKRTNAIYGDTNFKPSDWEQQFKQVMVAIPIIGDYLLTVRVHLRKLADDAMPLIEDEK